MTRQDLKVRLKNKKMRSVLEIVNYQNPEVVFKDVFKEDKIKHKEEVKMKSLNNLISLDQFTEKEVVKNAKKTKRTDVAKDILQEKKASAKQLAARKRFKEMIANKKKPEDKKEE